MKRSASPEYLFFAQEKQKKKKQIDSTFYLRSEVVLDVFSQKPSDFDGGTYYFDDNHEKYFLDGDKNHDCLVYKKDFKLEDFELLKHFTHPHILELVTYNRINKRVVTEKVNFGTLESFVKHNGDKLIDATNGLWTPKFINLLKSILKTLGSLRGHKIIHGDVSESNILIVDDENGNINYKLFGISGPHQGNKDLNGLAEIINYVHKTVGKQQNRQVQRFCSYLKQRRTVEINDALLHPVFSMTNDYAKRRYLENLMDAPRNRKYVNSSNIKWLDDDETNIRVKESENFLNQPYESHAWDFVRLVRNSIKHYKSWAKNIDSKLPDYKDNQFAYLNYVERQHPDL